MADIAVSFSVLPHDPTVKNYKTFSVARGNFSDVPKFLTKKVWSPIVWTGGTRAKEAFLQSSIIAVDVDEGKTIDETIEMLSDYGLSFVVATTKSHQKPKTSPSGVVKPPCDRYRVLIETDGTVTDRELYTFNLLRMINLMDGDKSGADGARYFFPSVDVVHVGKGTAHPWLPLPSDYVPEAQRFVKRREALLAQGQAGILQIGRAHV